MAQEATVNSPHFQRPPALPDVTGTPRATATVASGEPARKPAEVPAGAEYLVEQARLDAARRASTGLDQVEVLSVRAVEWPDSSLGCPQPGFMYSQIVTPGYRIALRAGGRTYEYHSDRGQRVVFCANPKRPLGSSAP